MLSKIQHGQNATVHIDGLDKELLGKIIWISPQAEFTPKTILTPDTRTSLVYAVKILVKNIGGFLSYCPNNNDSSTNKPALVKPIRIADNAEWLYFEV